jgi:hypothetical protein
VAATCVDNPQDRRRTSRATTAGAGAGSGSDNAV